MDRIVARRNGKIIMKSKFSSEHPDDWEIDENERRKLKEDKERAKRRKLRRLPPNN